MPEMGDTADEHRAHRPGTRGPALWSAAYLVGFTAFAVFASRHCTGNALMATLTFAECAVLAAAVGLFAAGLDPRELGIRKFALRIFLTCLLLSAGSAVVLVIASLAWGAAPLAGGLIAQLVILSFCLLIAAAFAWVRCVGSEVLLAQFVAIIVACALVGSIFFADPIVEADKSPEARGIVIGAILLTNPITSISWSLLRFDVLRRQIMYDRISVIGRWYRTPYPEWWQTVCAYAVISAILFVTAGLVRRRRLSRPAHKGGS